MFRQPWRHLVSSRQLCFQNDGWLWSEKIHRLDPECTETLQPQFALKNLDGTIWHLKTCGEIDVGIVEFVQGTFLPMLPADLVKMDQLSA